jgi:DNA-binding response OmpR family regulator
MYILVVDDDQLTCAMVQFALNKEGYKVETMDNPRGAMQVIKKQVPDLLILDVGIPYQNGFEFSRELLAAGYEIPIIFMTAQTTLEAKLQGFTIGADDYICKPFDYPEMVARVQAVMRRVKKNGNLNNQSIRVQQIELQPGELKVVMPDGADVPLTPTEMQVLRVLMTSRGQAVKRERILSEVWNDDGTNSNIVDVYIRRLRTKLEERANDPQFIVSVRGIGYKFVGN